MKRFIFANFILVCCAFANAQSTNSLCPKIGVIGPAGVTNEGDKMQFQANVQPTTANLGYFWTISRGLIESGQGTPAIVVRTDSGDASYQIVAKVSISGIPQGCEASASETGPVYVHDESGMPVDDFGRQKANDIRGRLDNFFQTLNNNPTQIGVVRLIVTKKEPSDRNNSRLKLVIGHAKFRSFDFAQLIFKFEKGDQVRTAFYRLPASRSSGFICTDCPVVFGSDLK